jgi:uncharacterized delta-60 repeat protein
MVYPRGSARVWFVLVLLIASAPHALLARTVVDPLFHPEISRVPSESSVWMQPNGKLLMEGSFTHVNGQSVRRLVRLNVDGTLDRSFRPVIASSFVVTSGFGLVSARTPFTSPPHPVSFNTHGDIYLTDSVNVGPHQKPLTRLRANGTYDSSFRTLFAPQSVRAVFALSDRTALVRISNVTSNHLATETIYKLKTNGAIDGAFAFSAGNGNTVYDVLPETDGTMIVGLGNSGPIPPRGFQRMDIVVKLSTNGTIDPNFQAIQDTNTFATFARTADGGLLVVTTTGAFYSSESRIFIKRFNAQGVEDAGFHFTPELYSSTFPNHFSVAEDGRFYIARFDGSISRYAADGSREYTFAPQPVTLTKGIFALTNGIVINRNLYDMPRSASLLRLNEDGTRDTNFVPRIEKPSAVYSIRMAPEGYLIANGSFERISALNRPLLTRLTLGGSVDPSYAPSIPLDATGTRLNNLGDALLFSSKFDVGSYRLVRRNGQTEIIETDGWASTLEDDLSIIGSFYSDGINRLNRTLLDGRVDSAFTMNSPSNVITVLPLVDGKLFTLSHDTNGRSIVRRLLHNGKTDPAFTPVIGSIWEVFPNADDSAYGSMVIGQSIYLVRLLSNGMVDSTFKWPFPLTTKTIVNAVTTDAKGNILVAGSFPLNGKNREQLLRLNRSGSIDPTFQVITDGPIADVNVLPDNRIVIAGSFSYVNGVRRTNLAAIRVMESIGLK